MGTGGIAAAGLEFFRPQHRDEQVAQKGDRNETDDDVFHEVAKDARTGPQRHLSQTDA